MADFDVVGRLGDSLRVRMLNAREAIRIALSTSPATAYASEVSATDYARASEPCGALQGCYCEMCVHARELRAEAEQLGVDDREMSRIRRQRESARRWEAQGKAEALLVRSLSERQREEYLNRGTITVRGSQTGHQFRLHQKAVMNIERIDSLDQEFTEVFCATPNADMPMADMLLAQKLSIENDERSFFRVANRMLALGGPE